MLEEQADAAAAILKALSATPAIGRSYGGSVGVYLRSIRVWGALIRVA
jgi:hypothetical protein